jgi:DNA-binding response OmpR family regulator
VNWCEPKGMRVLIVEDEERLADAIARGLRREGMAIDLAYDGGGALDRINTVDYDVVVLDRDLPVVHGDDVCRALRDEASSARVLMLTASGAVDDLVDGLSLGADDYLGKPFAFEELVARLRALGRRMAVPVRTELRCGDIAVDLSRRLATRGSRDLNLSPKELVVLEVLLRAEGAVVSAEDLLTRAWDEYADPFTNAPRVTMMTLRRKLGDPPVIETVVGAGYRIR